MNNQIKEFYNNLKINAVVVDVIHSPTATTVYFNVADNEIKKTLATENAIRVKFGHTATLSSGHPASIFKLSITTSNKKIKLNIFDNYINLGIADTNNVIKWKSDLDNNLLIGGATGQGKTTALKNIIYQLLKQGADVKLIDLKNYDFRNWHHSNLQKYTSQETALTCLYLVKQEIESRKKLQDCNYSNIYLIIDEFAELVEHPQDEYSRLIKSIAQIGRAFKVHTIIATQRPDSKTLNSSIKVNFTAKLGFKTSTRFDSATIINASGLERLQGKGHGLFISSEYPQPTQLQGYFLPFEYEKTLIVAVDTETKEEKQIFHHQQQDGTIRSYIKGLQKSFNNFLDIHF